MSIKYDIIKFADIGSALGGGSGYGAYGGCAIVILNPNSHPHPDSKSDCNPDHESDPETDQDHDITHTTNLTVTQKEIFSFWIPNNFWGSYDRGYWVCTIVILALTPTPILTLTQNLTLSVTMTTNLIKTPTITHTMNLTVILSFRKCDERNYFVRVLRWVWPREQDELWCDRGQFAIAVIWTEQLYNNLWYFLHHFHHYYLTLSSWARLSALEEGTGLDYNYNNYEHAAAAASTQNTDVLSYGTWTASVEGETTWTEKILPSIPHFSKGIHSSA